MRVAGIALALVVGLGCESPNELARRPAIPIYGVLLETRLDFT